MIRVVLATHDYEYATFLLRFLENTNLKKEFQLTVFNDFTYLEKYMQDSPKCHVLFGDYDWVKCFQKQYEFQISFYALVEEIESFSMSTILKFQPLQQTLHLLKNSRTSRYINSKNKTQIIAVYSAVPGIGKTTFSLNLVQHLTRQKNLRVFYWNLEKIPSLLANLEEKHSFSHLLYQLQLENEVLDLQPYIKHHCDIKFDYFSPSVNFKEMKEMTEKDTHTILEMLDEKGGYDCIVIDLSSDFAIRTTTVLNQASRIFWIKEQHAFQIHQAQLIQDQWSEKKEIITYVKRGGYESCLEVPNVNDWFQLSSWERALQSAEYQQAIFRIWEGSENGTNAVDTCN